MATGARDGPCDRISVDTAITRIVIVGGGTAGWLAACRIAAAAAAGRSTADRRSRSSNRPRSRRSASAKAPGRRCAARSNASASTRRRSCSPAMPRSSTGRALPAGRRAQPDDSYAHPFTPPDRGGPAGAGRGVAECGAGERLCRRRRRAAARGEPRPGTAPAGDARLCRGAELRLSSRRRQARGAARPPCNGDSGRASRARSRHRGTSARQTAASPR